MKNLVVYLFEINPENQASDEASESAARQLQFCSYYTLAQNKNVFFRLRKGSAMFPVYINSIL